MASDIIRIKIIDEYKQLFEKNKLGIEHMNIIFNLYKIDPLNSATIESALKYLIEERNKIFIPKPIKEIKRINSTKYDPVNTIIRRRKNNTIKIYEHFSQEEVAERKRVLDSINLNITLFWGMLSISEMYLSDLSDRKDIKSIHKKVRDTRPKENKFIKSFLENSSNYKMNNGKKIAELNNVSTSSVTRYFKNHNIVDKIYEELNERFTALSNLKNNIDNGIASEYSLESTINKLENVEFNFFYVKDIKERLQRKIVPKASLVSNNNKRNSNLK